ncbi:MAG: hypothetical protein VCA35_09800 [Roseibacillus sp.]
MASLKANEDIAFFESKVAPLLKANCYKCHSHESGKMKALLANYSRNAPKAGAEKKATK